MEYETLFRQFDEHLKRECTLEDLTKATINGFLNWLSETMTIGAKTRKPATVNKRRSCLLALAHCAMDEEVLPTRRLNVQKFPEDTVCPVSWTVDELSAMLRAARALKRRMPETRIKRRHWWSALILVCYDTALRITPIMRLRPEDYDAAAGILTARPETQKTRTEQLVRVSDQTRAVLRKLHVGEYPTIFPWRYDSRGDWRTLRAHLRRCILLPAGLPDDRKRMFHCFRKTTATEVALKVGDEAASAQLGHAGLKITQKHYIDGRRRKVVHAADVLDRPRFK